MPDRCRLCTKNDRAALVEELARDLWHRQRDSEIDPAWEAASSYWRSAMLGFAEATLALLERDHR